FLAEQRTVLCVKYEFSESSLCSLCHSLKSTGRNRDSDFDTFFETYLSACFRKWQASLVRHQATGEAAVHEYRDASFRGRGPLLPAYYLTAPYYRGTHKSSANRHSRCSRHKQILRYCSSKLARIGSFS